MAGSREAIVELIALLEGRNEIGRLDVKYAEAAQMPFKRNEGSDQEGNRDARCRRIDPVGEAGVRSSGEEWNALIADPDTVVIDTRNDYEIKPSVRFPARSIRRRRPSGDFPAWVEANRDRLEGKKIAIVLHRRHPLREGDRADAQDRSRRGLPSRRRHIALPGDMPSRPAAGKASVSSSTSGSSVRHGLKPGEARLCRACRRPVSPEGAVVDGCMSRGVSLRSLPCGADGSRPRAFQRAPAAGGTGQATQGRPAYRRSDVIA